MGFEATGKPSRWQGDLEGPCYAQCQAPVLELPSSRTRKIRVLGICWRKSGDRRMAMNIRELDGQSCMQEATSGCSQKRSLIRSG